MVQKHISDRQRALCLAKGCRLVRGGSPRAWPNRPPIGSAAEDFRSAISRRPAWKLRPDRSPCGGGPRVTRRGRCVARRGPSRQRPDGWRSPLVSFGRVAKAAAADQGATVVLHRKHFALAGSMLAIGAVGVGVLAFVALRRPELPPATPVAESTMPADIELTSDPAARPVADTAKPPTLTPSPTPEATAAETPGKPVNAPSLNTAPVNELPPMAFDAKALVGAGQRPREREAQILLADGKVTVTADNKDILHSVPYSGVVSVSYSRGRDPLWNSPQGPAAVAKMSGGTFGFIRGERHWIALRTKDTFVVLRLQDDQVKQVLGALAERTGRAPERVVERKAAR